jgi:hypothetical protein
MSRPHIRKLMIQTVPRIDHFPGRAGGEPSDDARLEVVHRSEGPVRDSSYFTNYGRLSWRWKLALAWVDGAEAIVHFREVGDAWQPHAIVQLDIDADADRIAGVRDYVHVDYLLRSSRVE